MECIVETSRWTTDDDDINAGIFSIGLSFRTLKSDSILLSSSSDTGNTQIEILRGILNYISTDYDKPFIKYDDIHRCK